MAFLNDIEVSSSQLKRFKESVIETECLFKMAVTSFCLLAFCPFQATFYFLVYYFFICEVRFICFPKWFGIKINTKFVKVLQFGLFIQALTTGFVVT